MDEEGEPEFLSGARARAVLDRLADRSSRLGSSLEVKNEEAVMPL
jgi:hypothetical protein